MESSLALAMDKHAHVVQGDLFDFDTARWPRKPYCSDDIESGIYPRSLVHAIKKKYIQANPPHLRIWSTFDIDRQGGGLAWEQCMLPQPSWAAINKVNGHAHLVYGLKVPVLIDSPNMRQEPMRYLAAIESEFRARLDADRAYSGLITKNPAHPMWGLLRGPKAYYELSELAEYVDISKQNLKKIDIARLDLVGTERNITLFEWLRQWAYRNIRQYKSSGSAGRSAWESACNNRALERNIKFPDPLDGKEVWCIAKSVAKWTWSKFDIEASDKRFSELQAHRGIQGGIKSGEARLLANENKRAIAVLMKAQGMTSREIASKLDVNQSTVVRWMQG